MWPARVSASTPLAATSTGTWPTAWTASVWKGTPCSRARSARVGTGCRVPTSLLAHITVTSATSDGSRSSAARSTSGCTRPSASTSSHSTTAPSWATSHSTASRTAWCSTALARMRVQRGSAARRAHQIPLTARLSLSVPLPVKTTSDGRAPRAAASCSRDSSTTRRARRPALCRDDALPAADSASRSAAVTVSTASGSMGVEAAWSR